MVVLVAMCHCRTRRRLLSGSKLRRRNALELLASFFQCAAVFASTRVIRGGTRVYALGHLSSHAPVRHKPTAANFFQTLSQSLTQETGHRDAHGMFINQKSCILDELDGKKAVPEGPRLSAGHRKGDLLRSLHKLLQAHADSNKACCICRMCLKSKYCIVSAKLMRS